MNKVLVIVGPTASGKSDLGVKLAQLFDGEVISADSRQVYKGLDVGTGKITEDEMQGIPHHLLDVADPKERFTASMYRELGEKALRDILSRGKLPIVVGGTGLYIDTLTCAINFPNVEPHPKLRKELEEKSAEELFSELEERDPIRASEIDKHNKRRLVRALEIVEALGKVPQLESNSPHEFVYIGLNPEKDVLEEKILQRLRSRMPEMKKEVEKLRQEGLSYERMDELGLEYRYLAKYIQGELDDQELEDELYKEIKKYAKRQMTWFKKNKNVKWFTLKSVEGFKPDEFKKIEEYLADTL